MAQFLKDEVKGRIIASALLVFKEKGYKQASIKEIAGDADVSVGNVYRYFANKEELFEAVISGVYDGVASILQSVEESKEYLMVGHEDKLVFPGHLNDSFFPLHKFIQLYQDEKDVFQILLKGDKGFHYEKTIVAFSDILKEYFSKFWGEEYVDGGLPAYEISALTNALIFGTIDLLNHHDQSPIDMELAAFLDNLISGYFYARNKREVPNEN